MSSAFAPSNSAGQASARATSNGNGGERIFEHIQDLQTKAREGYNPKSTISQLLDLAERGLSQAQTLNGFRRPDLAFVEYVRTSDIVLNAIFRHKDYTHVINDQPERAHRFKALLRRIKELDAQYASIKEIIRNNNLRNGTQPGGTERNLPIKPSPKAADTEVDSPRDSTTTQGKVKPTPSPKPDKLHGRALASPDNLDDRFAQLRVGSTARNSIDSNGTFQSTSIYSSPTSSRSKDDPFFSLRTNESSRDAKPLSTPATRPQGPRTMPESERSPATMPPLDTNVVFSMPQAPKAAYSPARNMQVAGGIAPPRHSARSLASTNPRKSSLARTGSISSTTSNGKYYDDPAINGMNGSSTSLSGRRRATYDPKVTEIEPQQLFDYLDLYNVLLIDFRSREDYDQGHIYCRSVMCIEPFSMRQGMSAEQLAESLIVSPDFEQNLFNRRDEFDLVVYYDQATASNAYLEQSFTQHDRLLKSLHEALCDFNQDRPLQRPPILLKGGIDAWVDLVGQQVLESFATISRAKQGSLHRRTPKIPARGDGSQLHVSRRRWREYNPLDEEEERKWRERARAESVVLPRPADGDDLHDSVIENDNDDENGSAIREFLARFPEAGKLTDKEFFAGTMPERKAPEPPTRVPMYPSAPHPSEYQLPPARPPPAAPRMSYNGVSERAASALTPVHRNSASTPYIPTKYLEMNLRLPKTGLFNFGNTCYMNSTVQALSATTPLSVFILEDAYRGQIQRSNWRSNSKGVMVELYGNLVTSLWKGEVGYLRPTSFRRFVGRAYQLFESDGVQQDAKEFFDFLMDCLHEDLNLNWSRTPLRALTDAEEARREQMPELVVSKLEWDRYSHRDFSFISGLFGGQHLSRLTCKTCGLTSSKYEYFSSISVEIPSNPRHWRDGRLPTLEDCLRSFCAEETLTGEEAWVCSRCKVARDTSKRITITRAPQILVVHFKRFDNAGNSTRKVRIPVDFPLENLDLGPFMLPPPSHDEAQAIAREYGSEVLKTDAAMSPPYLYDAYAVIRHIGATLQSGHYITAVKDRARQKWRWFNDTKVNEFSPQDLKGSQSLQNEEAYIVFYQRVQASGRGGKM